MDLQKITILSTMYAFFSLTAIIVISDIVIFKIEPSDSEMAHMLVGAMVGYMGSIFLTFYKNKKD